MLGKLLKYDMRSVGRFWWIAMLTMVGMSFCAGGSLRAYLEIMELQNSTNFAGLIVLLYMLSYLLFLLSVVGIGLCMIAVAILIIVRYFKHLFTDEGYLTFTLPVTRKQIFFSKMLNAVIWMSLSGIVLSFCVLIIYLISCPTYGEGLLAIDSYIDLLKSISSSFSKRGFWVIIQFVISNLISVASIALSVGVVYFCITLGATVVKRAKIVVGVGAYYLLNVVTNAVMSVFGTIPFFFLIIGFVSIMEKAPAPALDGAITLIMLIIFAVVAALAAFFYCLTLNILERRLNLA